MKHFVSTLLASAALCMSGTAIADDSSAALGAGGLQLTQSADIRMAAEDLYVSPTKVRVRFDFANDSSKDIDTVVAFVLPDIDTGRFWGSPIGTVTTDPLNFMGFKVTANGSAVPVQAEQRAIFKGRDVTDIVKAAGLPVDTTIGNGGHLADNLSDAKLAVLVKAGLVEHDKDSGVSPDSPNGSTITLWTVRTKFYWTQRFPAGKTVVFEQSYQPVTGETFFGQMELTPPAKSENFYGQNFCFDAGTRGEIEKQLATAKAADHADGALLLAFTTDYVLTTGNNWKGPIGRFHMTLDKEKPDAVLSLCWDGDLKKTGATTFEATRENFAPVRDIHMLVLQQHPPG